jgi:ectoine hydroxylase-related dioxygenase (phytanoyl-CoA dioxygenase family)
MRSHAVYETQAMLAALDIDGCVFVPGALTAEQCESARRRIDALEPLHWDETHAVDDVGATDRRLDRYLNVSNRDAYWLQYLDRPGIIELAESALGADCHIIGETAWRSHPGSIGEALHADYLPLAWRTGELPDAVRIPVFIMTVHYYLSEVTTELAPTRIVPGSHRAGRAPRQDERAWQGHEPEIVLASPGDALVFRSDVWHAGSDNRTAASVRYLLQVHYGRREMAQHFSPYLDWRFDPSVLAAASRRQRRLLGDHEPGPYD